MDKLTCFVLTKGSQTIRLAATYDLWERVRKSMRTRVCIRMYACECVSLHVRGSSLVAQPACLTQEEICSSHPIDDQVVWAFLFVCLHAYWH